MAQFQPSINSYLPGFSIVDFFDSDGEKLFPANLVNIIDDLP
jgi:hypothetical protein